ncbi:hypothetical protein [Paenibacillus sp. IITD108]|uniref:hypothetical protein n=1 Tax=Paenibacillus sp. IITD108 TaxID=3116649 RepID=UPI002F413CBB
MSKKLLNLLEEIANEIYKVINLNKSLSNSVYDMIKRMLNNRYSKIVNFTSGDLDKAYIAIGRNINTLKEKRLKAMESGSDLDEDEIYDLTILELKMQIIDAAILSRKEARAKKGEHPVLHKHIDYPVFSVDNPRRATLQKLQSNGIIIEKREGGYRQLYFKNENGMLLTDYDHKVFSSLCKLCLDQGFPKEMHVEIRELIEEMKIPSPGGGDYQSVRDSLMDIYNTSIVFEDSNTKEFDENTSFEYHRIFQAFSAKGKKFSSFKVLFQDYIHTALINGDFLSINMYLMNDLTMDTARSLYKFILNEYSKEEKEVYDFEFKILRSHIDVDRSNDHRANQSIKKAFQELHSSGIISEFEDVKIGTGNWMYYVKPNVIQLQYAAKSRGVDPLTELSSKKEDIKQTLLFFDEVAAGKE